MKMSHYGITRYSTNMIIQNKGKIHIQSESMWSLGMVQKGRHLQTVPSIKISHYEIKCVNMIIQNKENLLES